MVKFIISTIIPVAATVLAACGHPTGACVITGTWKGADGSYVYVKKSLGDRQYKTLDSALVRQGAFELSMPVNDLEKVTFHAGNANHPFLVVDGPVQVNCTTAAKEVNGAKINQTVIQLTGGPEQSEYLGFLDALKAEMMISLGISMMLTEAGGKDPDLTDSLGRIFMTARQIKERTIDSLVSANPDNPVSALIIANQAKGWGASKTEAMYGRLTEKVKTSATGLQARKLLEEMKRIDVGCQAPDFTLDTSTGGLLRLSDLRGKYVLLDFWASWCGPCIGDLPAMKALYDRYRGRGLEILGISLDDKPQKWQEAIAAHGITWPHVSSLLGWECPVAKLYNVSAVPMTILLDPDGTILAIGLRGAELEKKIEEVL